MTDRAVLISIKPKYCELIASGKKTVEVRKTRPKIPTPFKGYIYCTLSGMNEFVESITLEQYYCEKWYERKGNVIGEFVCDKIITVDCDSVAPFDKESGKYIDKETCLDRDMLWKYTDGSCAFSPVKKRKKR